jgi:hypothetical protein
LLPMSVPMMIIFSLFQHEQILSVHSGNKNPVFFERQYGYIKQVIDSKMVVESNPSLKFKRV